MISVTLAMTVRRVWRRRKVTTANQLLLSFEGFGRSWRFRSRNIHRSGPKMPAVYNTRLTTFEDSEKESEYGYVRKVSGPVVVADGMARAAMY
ncbi:hypothetical protein ACFX2A_016924 [Malus domestica]